MNEAQPITLYKNNSRNSGDIKGCSPLQLLCNLTEKCNAVGYYSYTHRWWQLKQTEHEQTRTY